MGRQKTQDIAHFDFRDLHPSVSLGTASDRYRGWLGQIYSEEAYRGRITSRTKGIKGKTFKEEVLPVESVEEYFQHFSVLEIDYTFYSLLLDDQLNPTRTYRVLRAYREYLREGNALILKVPQAVFARRLHRGGTFVENPDYLNPDIFRSRFFEPASGLLGPYLRGLIFEQEYQPKKAREEPGAFIEALSGFFGKIPGDDRYHIEVRTESYLTKDYFAFLGERGLGQVFSHWTWLPPLRRQFQKAGRRFHNGGGQCVIRLMTPLRMRYEDAYEKAFPFDRLVEGMLDPAMVDDAALIMAAAVGEGFHVNVLNNNRAGGNAPLIAQKVAKRFLLTGEGVA